MNNAVSGADLDRSLKIDNFHRNFLFFSFLAAAKDVTAETCGNFPVHGDASATGENRFLSARSKKSAGHCVPPLPIRLQPPGLGTASRGSPHRKKSPLRPSITPEDTFCIFLRLLLTIFHRFGHKQPFTEWGRSKRQKSSTAHGKQSPAPGAAIASRAGPRRPRPPRPRPPA